MWVWTFWRKPACRGALVGIVCALVCWWMNQSALVQSMESWALDNCFVFRDKRSTSAKVVIVAIDDVSLDHLDKPLAFVSPQLGKVISYLKSQHAAAIGVDLIVPASAEGSEYYAPGAVGDADVMGTAVMEAKNVVLTEWHVNGKWLIPIYQWLTKHDLDPAWTDLGFANLTVDDDTYLRQQQLRVQGDDGQAQPQFALAVFGMLEQLPASWFTETDLHLDGRKIPLDKDGKLLINFVGPPRTFPQVPFQDVLDAAEGRSAAPQDWNGATVLIGVTAGSQPDWHATSFANQSVVRMLRTFGKNRKAERMPGVEIHANIIATLVDRAFITTPWWLSTPLLLILMGGFLGAALARLSLEWGLLLAFAHHWFWKLTCMLAFSYGNWRVEMVAQLFLGVLVYAAVFGLRWRWIRQMMGMVKSEAVARAMEAHPGRLENMSEERLVTVMFTDIRNFTTFSERNTPRDVVRLLNEYFTAIVPAIEAHGGIVNQYIGDGLMIIFGAPNHQPDHALRAMHAAVAMLRRVRDLEQHWRSLGATEFRMGVGIHTGLVVIGTVGSPGRLDYTAIGDTVNTSARIESGNKELGTEILISHSTHRALSHAERLRFHLSSKPHRLALKGKQDAFEVYSVHLHTILRTNDEPQTGDVETTGSPEMKS